MDPNVLVPAAAYLRMSDRQQEFSLANQKVAIHEYAQEHGFRIIRTFSDEARSGLTKEKRPALSQLLREVKHGRTLYRAILVYDVSRWGRFQDMDEAAYWESICRHAGVAVLYCAEAFPNDGTPVHALAKALKRMMAAKFSRELGTKIYETKRRLSQLGFRMNGEPGYGLRRQVVSSSGQLKMVLEAGEWKSRSLDHVVLVHGPRHEVDTVRLIFRMFLRSHGKKGPAKIARYLNEHGTRYLQDKAWTCRSVQSILTNPKYSGVLSWGKSSERLGTRARKTPPDQWIIIPKGIPPIMSTNDFERAQALLLARPTPPTKISDEELLQRLKSLYRKQGRLTEMLIEKAPNLPSVAPYVQRFGSLEHAFELVGYRFSSKLWQQNEGRKHSRRLWMKLLSDIYARFPSHVEIVHAPLWNRLMLEIDGHIRVSVILCRHYKTQRKAGWRLHPIPSESGSLTLLALFAQGNKKLQKFHLQSRIDKPKGQYSFDRNDPWLSQGTKLNDLSDFYHTVLAVSRPMVSAHLRTEDS